MVIVYYVPRRIMRVIIRRATMLAGDRSQGAISPASILSEFRIRVFMRTLECNLVFIMILVHCTWYFATSSGHFDFLDLCVVVAYCNRACAVQMYKALSVRCQCCTKKKKNKKKITLRCMVIKPLCNSIFTFHSSVA